MKYRVDYNLLDSMYNQVNSQAETWGTELNAAKTAIERLINTSNMSGVGADAVRDYLTNVHGNMVQALISLVELHRTNFVLYKTDYQQTIDTGFDSVIDEEELEGIMQSLQNMKEAAVGVDEEVRAILRQVNDIFSTPFRSVTDAADVINQANSFCSSLSQKIWALENRHNQAAFSGTETTINLLTGMINSYLTKSRSFKSNYDPSSTANQHDNKRLTMLNSLLLADVNGKAEALQAAVEYHEAREEMENRIETAKWEKLLVSALVVVGSAIFIAAIPVSGPLVVGLVSGASSAIISANNEMMDLYVVDGDLSGDDWKQVGIEGGKGFVTGFATGMVGGVASKSLSGLTKGVSALHSTNTTVNMAAHVAVGSATEVAGGVVVRSVGEITEQVMDDKEGINWSDVGSKALDGKEIIKDAVIGGASGYYDGHKVDYSESMHSDYEQAIIDDMYAKGELESSVDPELDAAEYLYMDEYTYDMKKKVENDFIDDYIVKKKDDGLTWQERINVDNILSPDDYSHGKYDTIIGVNEALEQSYKSLDRAGLVNDILDTSSDGAFKSHDEIIQEVLKDN